jgi:hypothetical protein
VLRQLLQQAHFAYAAFAHVGFLRQFPRQPLVQRVEPLAAGCIDQCQAAVMLHFIHFLPQQMLEAKTRHARELPRQVRRLHLHGRRRHGRAFDVRQVVAMDDVD